MRIENWALKKFLDDLYEVQVEHGMVMEIDENCPLSVTHEDSEETFTVIWVDDNRDHLSAKREPETVSTKDDKPGT